MALTQPRIILVVDDELVILNCVGDMCQLLGYRILRAPGGEAALWALEAGIDILITDIWMPGLDGLGLLRQARAVAPALPVIVMTGYADSPQLAAMRALGIVGVLHKPFRLTELKAMIGRALSDGPPAARIAACPRSRILVVDDEASVRETFEVALEARGHTLALARDGREALRSLRERRFDLIFLDVLLPEFDCVSVLKAIKRQDAETAVVLITGFPHHAETLAALKYGPAMLLPKPIKLGDIDAALKIVFKESPASCASRHVRRLAGSHAVRGRARGQAACRSTPPRPDRSGGVSGSGLSRLPLRLRRTVRCRLS